MSRPDAWRLTGIGPGGKDVHFFPLQDAIEHEQVPDCICGPNRTEPEPGRDAYRHHRLELLDDGEGEDGSAD